MKNVNKIKNGLDLLLSALVPFLAEELEEHFGAKWWNEAVLCALPEKMAEDLPYSQDINTLDMQKCISLFICHWKDVFSNKLPKEQLTWAHELRNIRNTVSHMGLDDLSAADTWRALDTIERFCRSIDGSTADNVRDLNDLFSSPQTSKKTQSALNTAKTAAAIKIDLPDMESAFLKWAHTAQKKGGGLYSPRTIQGYSYELKFTAQSLVWSDPTIKLAHTNLFRYNTYDDFEQAKNLISQADNYEKINSTNYSPDGVRTSKFPNAFSSAMWLYRRFLSENVSVPF